MQDTTLPNDTIDQPLPPALYWSASLAAYLDERFDQHTLHGLIDSTGSIHMAWCDDGWHVLPCNDLPGDARRLVCEHLVAQ